MPNLLSLGAVCLGAASRILKSKIEKTAVSATAAAVVGVGLLCSPIESVQASECDPPIYDVCFHKFDSSWSSAGYLALDINFDVPSEKSSQQYEIVWRGLKKIRNDEGDLVETYENDSQKGIYGNTILSYESFWWPSGLSEDSYESYGCDIYEGKYVYSDGVVDWVRGNWVGSVSGYSYSEAAQINLDPSVLPSDLPSDWYTYYCTVDWEPGLSPLRYGYILGCWYWDSRQSDYIYTGDHGSPRFDYGSSCSYSFSPWLFVGGFCNDGRFD